MSAQHLRAAAHAPPPVRRARAGRVAAGSSSALPGAQLRRRRRLRVRRASSTLYNVRSARVQPYRFTIQPTVFLTTKGRRDFIVFFDAPSPARIAPGGSTRVRGARAASRDAVLRHRQRDRVRLDRSRHGRTRYFYRYGQTRDRASLDFQHALGHPSVRVLHRRRIRRASASTCTPFDSRHHADSARTCATSRHATGRTRISLRAGLTWDSRDREIGPQAGTWAELLVQRVDEALGATEQLHARGRRPVGTISRSAPRLALANRLLVQNTIGDVPFFDARRHPEPLRTRRTGSAARARCGACRRTATSGKGILCLEQRAALARGEFALLGRKSSSRAERIRRCRPSVGGRQSRLSRSRSRIFTRATAAGCGLDSDRASSWRSTSATLRESTARSTSGSGFLF